MQKIGYIYILDFRLLKFYFIIGKYFNLILEKVV